LIDIQTTVYDGSFHDVDSSESAFKIAGSIGFQSAVKKADVVLLEPVMKVEVVIPENFLGDVVGDLNSKRAQVNEMRDRKNTKVVDAHVPLSEMFGYATMLRSITQGRGSYSMEFLAYKEVPSNVVEKISTEKQKASE